MRERERGSNSVLHYNRMLNKHISLKVPMGNKPRKPCSHQILFIYECLKYLY